MNLEQLLIRTIRENILNSNGKFYETANEMYSEVLDIIECLRQFDVNLIRSKEYSELHYFIPTWYKDNNMTLSESKTYLRDMIIGIQEELEDLACQESREFKDNCNCENCQMTYEDYLDEEADRRNLEGLC